MLQYENQLSKDGYLELFFAYRKAGLITVGKNNEPIDIFSHPSRADKYRIDKKHDCFVFLSTLIRDFYDKRHEIDSRFGRLEGYVDKKRRLFKLILVEKSVFYLVR